MQEKIANLEIKIFYDSAIIKKKKKGRELSKSQCEQGPYRWHSLGQGSDSRDSGPRKVSPPPPQNHEWNWPRGHRTAPLCLSCLTAPFRRVTSQTQRPSGKAGERGNVAHHLCLWSNPGTWAAWQVPIAVFRVHKGAPKHPRPPPTLRCPPAAEGVHNELGVLRDSTVARGREARSACCPH